jgi:hypothetical protein
LKNLAGEESNSGTHGDPLPLWIVPVNRSDHGQIGWEFSNQFVWRKMRESSGHSDLNHSIIQLGAACSSPEGPGELLVAMLVSLANFYLALWLPLSLSTKAPCLLCNEFFFWQTANHNAGSMKMHKICEDLFDSNDF